MVERLTNLRKTNFDNLPVDEFWNLGNTHEKKMHRIHSYPAKFPAFITEKALDFATKQGLKVSKIADVFCGCGTVAFEANRNSIDFWGCDINPVATLIAKVKSRKYNTRWLEKYYASILNLYDQCTKIDEYGSANTRLQYWYNEKSYNDLYKLKLAIEKATPQNSDYRLFFLCAFSNILKATSRWLTKSIKPQIDPHKNPSEVLCSFVNQCLQMMKANIENEAKMKSESSIITGNILTIDNPAKVDMIITSPPYVTSYEYADLHQLSSLWLGFTEDYKELRSGSIGSIYHSNHLDDQVNSLNFTGQKIVHALYTHDKSKARSIAKYYTDMQKVATICHNMLLDNGLALFVIGNTEYKGVRIDNAKHLAESLSHSGFKDLFVTKRSIQNKILTPFRDPSGRFSADSNSRHVYAEEFIIVGRKS